MSDDHSLSATAPEKKCRVCRRPAIEHCDLDEPGLDHPSGCEMMHHEFKPSASLPASEALTPKEKKDEKVAHVVDTQYEKPLATASEAVAGSDHSQLPWHVKVEGARPLVMSSDYYYVVTPHFCPGPIDDDGNETCSEEANALFIVTACNSHAALVDALHTIEALICDKPLCGHFTAEEIRGVVRAAIAKVEGANQLPPSVSR